jgi:hypothetical protein
MLITGSKPILRTVFKEYFDEELSKDVLLDRDLRGLLCASRRRTGVDRINGD